MKTEVWLNPNRRALAFGFVIPVVLAVIGLLLVTLISPHGAGLWGYGFGWGLLGLAAFMMAGLAVMMSTPRLAYRDGFCLVYLRGLEPHRVPVEVVECFFLGQGPSYLPARGEKGDEASTIVVRLAEAAHEWNHIDVKPSLGHWCDGYITIRGTWCEPINAALLKRLNERLVAIHRQRRSEASGNSSTATR